MRTAVTLDRDHDLVWQASLFGGDVPSCDHTFAHTERLWLDATSWVDYAPNWLHGADQVFDTLAHTLPWSQREVVMWERLLPEPRLTWWSHDLDVAPPPMPVLGDVRAAVSARYDRPFDTIGCNLYRDGRDSVAWHADRERFEHEDPVVVIVSVGAPRTFMLRPRGGGGRSCSFRLGHGDLFVMGGACQHDWEHCVPKAAHVEGPRLSIMFRHHLAAADTA
jgi:alkylated DNA repair dioxygenase AlkB